MIPRFGMHYRLSQFAIALDRLRGMPPGMMMPVTEAARTLGIREPDLRALLRRHPVRRGRQKHLISAATLRYVIRKAYEVRKWQ